MSALSKIPAPYLIGGGLVVLVVGYVAVKGFKGAGYAVGSAVVDTGLGVVGGVNDALGIPRTSQVVNWFNGVVSNVGSWWGNPAATPKALP